MANWGTRKINEKWKMEIGEWRVESGNVYDRFNKVSVGKQEKQTVGWKNNYLLASTRLARESLNISLALRLRQEDQVAKLRAKAKHSAIWIYCSFALFRFGSDLSFEPYRIYRDRNKSERIQVQVQFRNSVTESPALPAAIARFNLQFKCVISSQSINCCNEKR